MALADRLVLTKTDLASRSTLAALRERLATVNQAAHVVTALDEALDVAELLRVDAYTRGHRETEVARWFSTASHLHHIDDSRHDSAIRTFCMVVDDALEWTAFGVWLTMLLHCHGDKVLRVKGMLNVQGVATPVVVNGVQHLVHPPVHLARWPDTDRRSRLVFIVQGLAQQALEESLAAFNELGAVCT